MNKIIVASKQSFFTRLHFLFVYSYLQFKITVYHIKTATKMLMLNETRWYYCYTTKKVLILTGVDYWKSIRVDLGDIAYFNVKQKDGKTKVIKAELF